MKLILAYYHDFVIAIIQMLNPSMSRTEYLSNLTSPQTDFMALALFILTVTVISAAALGLIAYSVHGIIWGKSSKS